jgi:SAM-dependent methyltransferase
VSSLLRFWRRSGPNPSGPDTLPPPDTSLHPVGGVSAERGANQMRLLRHWGLQPTSQVLEIGCGVGRLAYELASFLDADGRYSGFDISPKAIAWCNEHYAPRLPNFRFDLVDVSNVRYRPARGGEASTVGFPYPDGEFDVACAFAVFMHMQLTEIANYLEEIGRVLKPDGVGVVTFRAIAAGERPPRTRDRDWVAVGDGVYTIFPETPGRALAYDDALVRATIEGAGLDIAGAITGKWHNRPVGDEPALGADVFVVKRRAA